MSHINHHNPDTLSGINRQFLTYKLLGNFQRDLDRKELPEEQELFWQIVPSTFTHGSVKPGSHPTDVHVGKYL